MHFLFDSYKGSIAPHYRAPAVLALLVGLHFLFYFLAQPNFIASDDLAYARIAYAISEGSFKLNPYHFTNRFGVTIPTAVSYFVFGVNKYSTTFWPLLSSILTIFLIFFITSKIFDNKTAIFSSLLLTTNTYQIKSSMQLLPDIIVSMLLFGCVSALLVARKKVLKKARRFYSIIVSLCFLLGILSKLTALFILPFLTAIFISDIYKKKNYDVWLWIFFSIVLLAFLYLGGYYVCTGEVMYRMKGVKSAVNDTTWSYIGKSYQTYIERLTYQPLQMIFREPGYVIALALSIPSFIMTLRSESAWAENTIFFGGYAISILLCFWFFPTSFSHYSPLPLVSRYVLPMVPPLCILGGVGLRQLFFDDLTNLESRTCLAALISLFFVICLTFESMLYFNTRVLVYSGFAIIFLILVKCLLLQQQRTFIYLQKLVLISLVCSFFVIPFYLILIKGTIGETRHEKVEREVLLRELSDLQESTIMFTDSRSLSAIPFYFGFELPPNVQLIDWNELVNFNRQHIHKAFLFINKRRVQRSNRLYGYEIPGFVEIQPSSWNFLGGRDGIYLFDISNTVDLDK